jgi:serine/threonine protein kinase
VPQLRRPLPLSLANLILPFPLLCPCMQVCDAMAHLSRKNVLHRDLAARNVLVWAGPAAAWHVKLADFGCTLSAARRGSGNGLVVLLLLLPPFFASPVTFPVTRVDCVGSVAGNPHRRELLQRHPR